MRIYSSGAGSVHGVRRGNRRRFGGNQTRQEQQASLEMIRAQHKTAKLAIQYGVGAETLSTSTLACPSGRRGRSSTPINRVTRSIGQWVEDQAKLAKERGYVETDFRLAAINGTHERPIVILNFPQQAGCAELLRCACIPVGRCRDGVMRWLLLTMMRFTCTYETERCRRVQGRPLKVHLLRPAKSSWDFRTSRCGFRRNVVCHPEHYEDADGAEIWEIVF